jgi:hypothetical protein
MNFGVPSQCVAEAVAVPGWAWMSGRIFAGRTSNARVGPQSVRAHLLSVLRRPTAPSLVLGIVVAASFIVVETLAVLLLKQLDPQDAFETLYLLGVWWSRRCGAWAWRRRRRW